MELIGTIKRQKVLDYEDPPIGNVYYYRITGDIKVTPPRGAPFTQRIFLQIGSFVNTYGRDGKHIVGFHFYHEDPEGYYSYPINEVGLGVVGRKYFLDQRTKEIDKLGDITCLEYQVDGTYVLLPDGDRNRAIAFPRADTEKINAILSELYKQPVSNKKE